MSHAGFDKKLGLDRKVTRELASGKNTFLRGKFKVKDFRTK